MTMTLAPSGARSKRSATSWFSMRKQPEEAAQPMLFGVLVPWMR